MAKINTVNYQTVAAWHGSQDLFVIEQPDGTKVATPNMVRQFMESFYDDVPTEGSERAVKSGGIFSAIDDIKAVKVTDTFSASPTKSGVYINTSGDTVDITSFVSNSDWECWIFPVVPGDSFVITVEGGGAPRAYCFIDENGNVLSRAAASASLTQELITAEKKGFCIIQNFAVTVTNPSIVGTLAVPDSAYAKIGDLSQTGLTGDNVAAQLTDANTALALINSRNNNNINLMKNRGDVGGDLNDKKVNGLYTFRTSDTNTPTSWGTLMVINVTPDNLGIAWVFQVAFGTDGHIYHRRSINGAAFNAWSTIV